MSYQDGRIELKAIVSSSHPNLLQGLDVWLHLGLLSEGQVKQLCQRYLTCPLPEKVASTSLPASTPALTTSNTLPKKPKVVQPSQPSWVSQMLQSLKAELSVRWLLFLGVLMVVVSSGVLAATQWERFPAYGQYGVLLSYTIVFWVVSFWASKQRNLQLTAQTLQLVTLFLIPVNFWAIDGFHLWGNLLEWVIVAIASIVLTGITLLVFRDRPPRDRSVAINYLALSYLQWGWKLPLFPLIAVYLGIIGTTIFLIWRYAKQTGGERENAGSLLNTENAALVSANTKIGIAVYAVTVLLVRAIFGNYVEITELGLAIAICGWLFAWLSWQNPSPLTFSPPFSPATWEIISGSLLFLGWIFSVGAEPSWQAIAVSGLGYLFFLNRLQRFWLHADFAAILAIGLQALWLFWRAIPLEIRQLLVNTGIQLSDAQNYHYVLLSLGLFPYVIWILILTDWLYRREKENLAEFGEAIALCFGVMLTGIGLVNPLLRSLNLLASTATLGCLYLRRRRSNLVYLTHVTAILTITSAIDYFFPNFNQENWASFLLVLMVGEWGFNITGNRWRRENGSQTSAAIATESSTTRRTGVTSFPNTSRSRLLVDARESAWYIGLTLAGLSYVLFVTDFNNYPSKIWWSIAPGMLTLVAVRGDISKKQTASWLSIIGLGIAQVLTLPIPAARLVSLGIATALMLVNTYCLRELKAAIITVGFAIAFLAVALWQALPALTTPDWLLAIAIAIAILWFLQTWFLRLAAGTDRSLPSGETEQLALPESQQNIDLFLIYGKATDIWGIALCIGELFLLTLHSLAVYRQLNSPSTLALSAIVITSIAVVYRHWYQPKDWGIFAIGWGLELFTAEIIGFAGHSIINLSVANIALGLLTQLLGDWWRRRVGASRFPTSLHAIPLLYGALGAALRWGIFTDWTGLSSIGISFIAIGIGRRSSKFQPLVYLGLAGISISAYELLLYQLSKSSGGAIGDGLIAMAALGTSIMYAYRVLSPWLSPYLTISLSAIKIVAHLHWIGSSFLLILASLNPIKASLLVGLGTGILLIRYAVFQGRRHSNQLWGEIWIYLAILELIGLRIYWVNTPIAQLFGDPLAPWRAAIATIPAIFIYLLPWESWGWPKRPWQIAAFLWPLLMLIETASIVHPIALLIVAGFYILVSRLKQQIRFTYLSAVLIDWAAWRWFGELRLSNSLWYVIPIGLSLLYVAQVDPELTLPERRQTRHSLRTIAISIVCFTSLWTEQWTGLGSGFLSIFTILAGLALRIRAFLYIGTATFLINAINQLVILNFRYAFLKWLIGLIVGIIFIWIAANFETRREQITAFLRNWISELGNWE